MLGMSFATVIGIIDWLVSFLTNLLMGRYRTVRRLTRKYSERRRQRILANMPIKHIGTEPISPDISIGSSLSLESEVSLPRASKTQSILGKIFPWTKENSDSKRDQRPWYANLSYAGHSSANTFV